MKSFSGIFTALVTPFQNGEIDWTSLKRVLRAQLDGGVHGLVINGTTGESPTLTKEEKQSLFSFVKSEVAGAIPLVMGTGGNNTAESVEATRLAASWGADAALCVVPYYNKPPQRGLFQHFQKIAECSSLPVLLYNVPGRTITKLEPDTIKDLSRLPNIIGIKDATGDIASGAQLIRFCGPGFLVTSGDDGTFLDLMAVGGKGVISVASNIMPKQFVRWYSRATEVETKLEFDRFRDLNDYLYVEANPIPVKMAMMQMGLIASAELRLPLVSLTEPKAVVLRDKLKALDLV